MRSLNQLYQSEPALSALDNEPEGFSWIDPHDSDNSTVSFVRRSKKPEETLVLVCNCTPVPRLGYRLGVPDEGAYYEVLNSDDNRFGGSGLINTNMMQTTPIFWQSWPHSIQLTLPPLATVILKRQSNVEAEEKKKYEPQLG